jgi:hypothetical protein
MYGSNHGHIIVSYLHCKIHSTSLPDDCCAWQGFCAASANDLKYFQEEPTVIDAGTVNTGFHQVRISVQRTLYCRSRHIASLQSPSSSSDDAPRVLQMTVKIKTPLQTLTKTLPSEMSDGDDTLPIVVTESKSELGPKQEPEEEEKEHQQEEGNYLQDAVDSIDTALPTDRTTSGKQPAAVSTHSPPAPLFKWASSQMHQSPELFSMTQQSQPTSTKEKSGEQTYLNALDWTQRCDPSIWWLYRYNICVQNSETEPSLIGRHDIAGLLAATTLSRWRESRMKWE